MLEAILRGHGLSVGLYTSPHLEALNERLVWDGRPIPDEELAEVFAELAALESLVDGEPTWFELVTAAAFAWFAQQAVDVAVVEVGLLGRYDATNVADGLVAVVTNVGRDHTDGAEGWREAIAGEKAGIIKPGSTLVLGETDWELQKIFEAEGPERTWRRDRDFAAENNRVAVGGRALDVRTPRGRLEDLFLPVHGAHQGDNLALAVAAAEAFFDRPLDAEVVAESLADLKVPGRFEIMGREPLLVLDGAHNPEGMAALTTTLHDDFADVTSTIVVLGMLAGRDPDAMLEALELTAYDVVICTTPPSPRALPATEVAEAVARAGLEVEVVPDVAQALERARGHRHQRGPHHRHRQPLRRRRRPLVAGVLGGPVADEGGVLVGEDALTALVGEGVAEGDDADAGSALRRAAVGDLVHVGQDVTGADRGVVHHVGRPERGYRRGADAALHAERHVHGEDVDGGGDQAAELRGGRRVPVDVERLGVEPSAELEDLLLGHQVGGIARRDRADLEVLVVAHDPLPPCGGVNVGR